MGKSSVKSRLREFFEQNVGRVITHKELMDVGLTQAGGRATEWARRVRELREDEGMKIRTHKDRADLKPGEYLLEDLKREPRIARTISKNLRNDILERNGFTCQWCGRTGGDPDPTAPGRKVRLDIDHVVPHEQGGTNDRSNLRVLCSVCNEARSNIQAPSETALNILARIRKLPRDKQREIYEVLKRTFACERAKA